MRLNFTGRRKIDKQHAKVAIRDDPPGSDRGHYFELAVDFTPYKLPAAARVFIEAARGLTLMRFDFGTVGAMVDLPPAGRRLSDFGPEPDGVAFRLKVVQPDGPEAGKLLAEADGLHPDDAGGVSPLIRLCGADLGPTPWRLELIPTDPDLPTLYINTKLGGKEYAKDPVAKPLLMTAAAREVFSALVWETVHEDDETHWTTLWAQFATQVLKVGEVPDNEDDEQDIREWVESAVNAFAAKEDMAGKLSLYMEGLEMQGLEEIN